MWFGGGKPKQEVQPDALGSVPIFAGLPDDKLRSILGCCEEATFEAGATLFKADTIGDAAFFILSGSASVKAPDSGKNAQQAECGALLGELTMLVDVTYNGTATARERVRALAIRRKALHQVMDADPSIAEHFSQKLVNRLIGLAEELKTIDAQFAALEEAVAEAI